MSKDTSDSFYLIEMFGEYLTIDGYPLKVFRTSQSEQIVRALQTDAVKEGIPSDEAHKFIRYVKITS